eukprot:1656872-Prymnesium_polylepis.1
MVRRCCARAARVLGSEPWAPSRRVLSQLEEKLHPVAVLLLRLDVALAEGDSPELEDRNDELELHDGGVGRGSRVGHEGGVVREGGTERGGGVGRDAGEGRADGLGRGSCVDCCGGAIRGGVKGSCGGTG